MTGVPSRRRRGAVLLAVSLVLAALAGCTGVPGSSAPQTIKPIAGGEATAVPAMSPAPGVDPRELVTNFLEANAIEAGRHASARTFLSTGARSKWSDTTATIVTDEVVGTYQAGKPTVVVHARQVGTLGSDGTYTPSLFGLGHGGGSVAFEYGIKQVDGQYRIDSLPKGGLLLTTEQFQQTFKQHLIYFYDLAGRYLVPDLRWSGLSGSALEAWLVGQLATGPRPELSNTVNGDSLPTQASVRTVTVKRAKATTDVEVRGARGLDAKARNQLAAQVSYTLNDSSAGELLSITDGGRAVRIPAANSTEFTAASFAATATGPVTPAAEVYYLRNGRVIGPSGRMLAGPVNNRSYYLNSVALERTGTSTTLNVAGVAGSGPTAQLVVGTQRGGLHPTTLTGVLSRPAWVPGSNEVWVAAGRRLYRTIVGSDGKPGKPQPIAVPPSAAGDQILSLRLSPEGSRVAMVLQSGAGAKQLQVGSIVRSGGQARVDTLTPVSPEGVAVTDVAWIESLESLKLVGIGYPQRSGVSAAKVYEVNADGSLWSARTFTLPDSPEAVTITAGQLAWVSSGGFVWRQNTPSTWVSPGPSSQTVGSAPVYLE